MRNFFNVYCCLSFGFEQPQSIKTSNKAIQNQPLSEISVIDEQIEAAKKKLPLLHEGMSKQEVLNVLGLPADYILSHGGDGGGPTSFFGEIYQLNEHHHLILDSDYSRRKYSNVVISGVNIDNEAWRDEAHKNIE